MVLARANETGTALTFVQLAIARTQIALNAPIGQRVPPARRMTHAANRDRKT